MTEEKSALVLAIEGRKRTAWEFEAANFLAKGTNPLGKFRMRVATVGEQNRALLGANQYLKALAKESADEVSDEVLGNAKMAYLMHTVCLNAERDIPAFPSGKWMLDELSRDEIAVLVNHYHECLRLTGPIDLELDEEKVIGLAAVLAANAGNDGPNIALLPYSQGQLGEIVVRLSKLLVEATAPQADGELAEVQQ